MSQSKIVEFFNKDFTTILHVDSFHENYYLNKGYKKINNQFIKILYLKILRYPILFFRTIKKAKINFRNPPKKDFLIYDDMLKKYLKIILNGKKFFILETRIERIQKIYITKEILIYIFRNFFKRSLKQNYLSAIINQISPKYVLTHIDNSRDFFLSVKIFENKKIKFIAIQNAGREGDDFEKFYYDELFVFGDHYKDLYMKKNIRVNKFHITGSLKTSLIKECLENKYENLDQNKYDICLISEPQTFLNGDFSHIKNYTDIKGRIAEYTVELCKKKKLKLIFPSKFDLESNYYDFDKKFYEKYLEGKKFNITQGYSKDYNSYYSIMQSKLIIGVNSTMLQESIYFKKKILSCNFIDSPEFNLNFPDECILKEDNYEDFEKKVLHILSINHNEYINRLSKKFNYIMKTDFCFKEKFQSL